MGKIRMSISGWRYKPWRGVFYPPGLAQRRELELASRALSYDEERLDRFLSLLPAEPRRRLPLRHAVEIRHASFVTESFIALLRRHEVALVIADTAGKWPYLEDVTADFMYLRLHGDEKLYVSGYTDAALAQWAARTAAWAAGDEPRGARLASRQRAKRTGGRDV